MMITFFSGHRAKPTQKHRIAHFPMYNSLHQGYTYETALARRASLRLAQTGI
jgi:hypothetical protein